MRDQQIDIRSFQSGSSQNLEAQADQMLHSRTEHLGTPHAHPGVGALFEKVLGGAHPGRRLEDLAELPLRTQTRPENPPIQIRGLQNHSPGPIAKERDGHPIIRITKATQGIGPHDKDRVMVSGTNRLIRGRQSVGKSGTSRGNIKGRLLGEAETIMQKTPMDGKR